MADKFIDIKTNFDQEIKNFSDMKSHIRMNAEELLDKSLDRAVNELKALAKKIIQDRIRIKSTNSDDPKDQLASPTFNIPKAKNDIVKYLFGQDIANSDYLKKSINPNVLNDNSNVFPVKDNRIKIWQSVSDSSTYSGEESKIRNRLINGIFIDEASGKLFKVDPKAVKGVKLECSRTEGGTLDSDKKFEAYKNSQKMSRQKDGSPSSRLAVWTVKQEDVAFAMRNSISIDELVDRILSNDFDTAHHILSTINKGGELNDAVDKLNNLKLNKDLTPDVAAIADITKLISNLRIEKKIMEKETRYTLFSTYGDEAEKNEKFFDMLREQVFLWKVGNEEFWIKSIVDGIVVALKNYEGKARLVVT